MKELLVYGRSESAKRFIKLMEEDDVYKVIGVTDSFVNQKEVGTYYYGISICNTDEVLNQSIDQVVICSNNCVDAIVEYLKKRFPKLNNVCSADQFIIAINEQENPSWRNNQLYHYFLSEEHNTMTKWLHYFDIYEQWFSKYKNREVVFCEIGVFKGGSLEMWKKYFGEKATIIGVDVDSKCIQYKNENEKINVEIGSQGSTEFWNYIKNKYPRIDILLDDGGHEMSLQKITFDSMFSHISDGGIYMCEDTHTSYWKEFGGEYKGDTFVEQAKNLVDELNAFHSRTDQLNVTEQTKSIKGVHFYDSIIVVEKKYRRHSPVSVMKESGKTPYLWP